MSLSSRINEIRYAAGVNKSQFGKSLGVSHAAVQQWENGETKSLSFEVLFRIEKKYGYSPEWVNQGKLPKRSSKYLKVSENTPTYAAGIAINKIRSIKGSAQCTECSIDRIQCDDPSVPYFRKDWIELNGWDEDKIGYIEVVGNAMEVSLFHGDKVLIDEGQNSPENGFVYAIQLDGEIEIKRLQKRGRSWWLTSDNPAHSRFDAPLEDPDTIVGRVVFKISGVI